MRKFQAIIFYDNKENLDRYLHGFQFDKPIREVHNQSESFIEYDHFHIRLFNRMPTDSLRGHKCDLVAIESLFYNSYEFRKSLPVIDGMLAVSRFNLPFQVF
jgi:hypothetical protein